MLTVLNVHYVQCPVMDQESNVQFEGYWQTLSTKAALTIRVSKVNDTASCVAKIYNLFICTVEEPISRRIHAGVRCSEGGQAL